MSHGQHSLSHEASGYCDNSGKFSDGAFEFKKIKTKKDIVFSINSLNPSDPLWPNDKGFEKNQHKK